MTVTRISPKRIDDVKLKDIYLRISDSSHAFSTLLNMLANDPNSEHLYSLILVLSKDLNSIPHDLEVLMMDAGYSC